MNNWKNFVSEEWNRRLAARPQDPMKFPLIDQTFNAEEIVAVMDVVMSGQLTMAHNVREFEKKFAEYVGAPYAVMVNSGSSANLLAFAAAANFQRKHHLKVGDEVLIPAVCWSTSVWPIFQMGLQPVFVDVDPKTLNVDLNDLRKKITPKTKALLAVHILGNSAPMEELLSVVQKHNLILIEDTCESLGSLANNKLLGTLGSFGTYSFYFSHHMTTGEGGMVVCKTLEDYDLVKCLRAHGWSRELSNRQELEKKYSDVDPRFLFVNMGYNVRPMELQAALGLCQLKKLDEMNANRIYNQTALVSAIHGHAKWAGQFEFIQAAEGTQPVWFGFCALLSQKYANRRQQFLSYLSSAGVENRPIVSGNFVRQPALQGLGLNLKAEDFVGAEKINNNGFFIGLHTNKLNAAQLERLANVFLSFEF
jgi:CDP-6-deoxy-D-xylo-4-hexulose-3-dehydrase